MKITGRTQHIQGTNQETLMKGGDFLGAGKFTVKTANVEFNDGENRYFTIIFENNEGRQYKRNQFVPPFQQDYQEKQYIELLNRLGIKLNLPDSTFGTGQLIDKIGTIVLKSRFNEEQDKYLIKLSYVKVWNKDDEMASKPGPKTDEMKRKEQQTNGKQTPVDQ